MIFSEHAIVSFPSQTVIWDFSSTSEARAEIANSDVSSFSKWSMVVKRGNFVGGEAAEEQQMGLKVLKGRRMWGSTLHSSNAHVLCVVHCAVQHLVSSCNTSCILYACMQYIGKGRLQEKVFCQTKTCVGSPVTERSWMILSWRKNFCDKAVWHFATLDEPLWFGKRHKVHFAQCSLLL